MKKIMFIIIVATLYGCGDEYVPYIMNIDNKTEDTIKIVFSEKSPYAKINPDSLIFSPMKKKLLYGAEGRVIENGCNYTGIREEECEVYIFSGKKLKKEIWDVNNWNCDGCFNCGWEMNFVITKDDLE